MEEQGGVMQYKLGTPYNDYVMEQLAQAGFGPKVEEQHGTSGFWSQPESGLDPRLIDPKTCDVRDDVRKETLDTLYNFWREIYDDPEQWSTVWIAGSALSHQYTEHEQPDLDVLIGVDYPKFYADNPGYRGLSKKALSDKFNDEFRSILDMQTLNFMGEFEATFYVNPGATDIRSINPYAAYNLSDDEWTVEPIDVPQQWDPRSQFPTEWWQMLDTEVNNASTLVDQYSALADRVKSSKIGSIQQTSSVVQLRKIIDRATGMFTDIHSKRKMAFSPNGKGFLDFYNLRWQVHKKAGTVKALHDIATLSKGAKEHEMSTLYGGPIDSPETALLKAQLFDNTYGKSAWYRRHV